MLRWGPPRTFVLMSIRLSHSFAAAYFNLQTAWIFPQLSDELFSRHSPSCSSVSAPLPSLSSVLHLHIRPFTTIWGHESLSLRGGVMGPLPLWPPWLGVGFGVVCAGSVNLQLVRIRLLIEPTTVTVKLTPHRPQRRHVTYLTFPSSQLLQTQ